ncbi:DUF899 domain-containing protein [Actinosynnema pretiosum subsp. pretiosum]|uniref:CalU12 protein n=2 Tax=Actinosynnema TaxID=40566 RepID=C6WH50_ACTMD|nr:DUF899 domain-containing protein [Actinosynnema mirum]ACU37969.1 protein of unknown function DUF899 thioredoxin family protein [Actinosynnema mirum DSM 43827]AXX31463.1 hypothetical protein APASM_4098 [Actinosynnema pretiosum subsp. pretiosum]QUF04496.1 DUF899 domain-containing protein [Actinosynnema pretiosum subsp. pretiosum]
MSSPQVVTRAEWLQARKVLLEKEKEVTRARDEIAAQRRELPMVLVEKDYRFQGPDGELGLLEMFEGRRQLVVRHYMYSPGAQEGCIGCSMQADSVGELAHMWARDTTFAMVSRAPYPDFQPFKARMGWTMPWYSSFGSDFNYDYEVSTEQGESPGVSAFYREGDQVFHTYSVFDRGGEIFKNFYNYLDITHLGRREDELEHPWDWWRFKDRYEAAEASGPGENWWNNTRFKG